MQKWIW